MRFHQAGIIQLNVAQLAILALIALGFATYLFYNLDIYTTSKIDEVSMLIEQACQTGGLRPHAAPLQVECGPYQLKL